MPHSTTLHATKHQGADKQPLPTLEDFVGLFRWAAGSFGLHAPHVAFVMLNEASTHTVHRTGVGMAE